MIKLPESKNVDLSPGYEDDVNTLMDIGFNRCLLEIKRLNATAQPASDGWVTCSERIPDTFDKYQVYLSTGDIFNEGAMQAVAIYGKYGFEVPNVTHWIPLPAAPGGQENEQ